jgi:hypothetical protein
MPTPLYYKMAIKKRNVSDFRPFGFLDSEYGSTYYIDIIILTVRKFCQIFTDLKLE